MMKIRFSFYILAALIMNPTLSMGLDIESMIGKIAVKNIKNKRVLLAGATGNNGRHILSVLSDLDVEVRAMSRNIKKAKRKFGEKYNWVEADVTKPETLLMAVDGVDIIISAVATKIPFGSNRPENVDYFGVKNLVSAAKAANVSRLIIITSSSSGVKDHFLNKIFNDTLMWKAKAEKILVNSGLDYVIVCPSVIDDDIGGVRKINLIPRLQYQPGMKISRADLAVVVVASAGHPDARNRIFTVINESGIPSDGWLAKFESLPSELNLPN